MISETEVLENGPGNERCQVVRWVRSFPFSFISKREYVIARRMFTESGCLYGISKVRACCCQCFVNLDCCSKNTLVRDGGHTSAVGVVLKAWDQHVKSGGFKTA